LVGNSSKVVMLMTELTDQIGGVLVADRMALNLWMGTASRWNLTACSWALSQSMGVLAEGWVEMVEFKLSDMEKDALAEVATIACGNASAALSSMLGDREIGITTPVAEVTPLKDIVKLVGGPKKLVVGIHTQISGDLSGNAVVVFPRESAFSLADLLGDKTQGTTQVIEEKDQKLINGAGLAIVSSYLGALKTFLELKVEHGDPKFFSAFGESVADFGIVGLGEAEETFLVNSFKAPFSMGPEVKGEFMFLLALKPVDSLLRAIRNKLKTPKEAWQ